MELSYANNPRSLFRKYHHLVTSFARTSLGRDYLEIPEHILLLTPNGYHRGDGGNQVEFTFYTKPIFSSKLYKSLYFIDRLLPWIQDENEMYELFIEQVFKKYKKSEKFFSQHLTHARFDAFGPLYPNPHTETTTVDGVITLYNDAGGHNWAWFHDAATGSSAADNSANPNPTIGIRSYGGGAASNDWLGFDRAYFLFDISSLGGGEVTSATFSYYVTAKTDNFTDAVALVNASPAANTSLATGDYDGLGTTQQATNVAMSAISTSAYFDMTINATGLTTINSGSIVKFGLRNERDRANSRPTSGGAYTASRIGGYMADQAGTTTDPKLTGVYTSSAVKTVLGLAKASVKTVNGLAIASVKTINGLT